MKSTITTVLLASAMAALLPPASGFAQEQGQVQAELNRIEALEVAEQGGSLFVRLQLAQPLAAPPASFSVANPARIAFDFPATANALGRAVQEVGQGDLRSANIVQAGDRTRLVLNLLKMTPYETRVDGNNVVIALKPVASQAYSKSESATSTNFAESKFGINGGNGVRDINFRRGSGGEGRVLVQLPAPDVGVDIKKQGGNLVVEFINLTLPEHLRRRSDVTDFATPIASMFAQQHGDNVRLVVSPVGSWEHNAYQNGDQFVLEVRKIVEDNSRLVPGGVGKYSGEKLSLNFQDIDVRSVLQVIAEFTSFNIVASDAVQGNVTLRLKDVPWDQALEVVLQAKGLNYVKEGDVIWVATLKEIDDLQTAQAQRQRLDLDLEPLETETFQINYHKASEIASLIKDQVKGAMLAVETSGQGANRNVPLAQGGAGSDRYTSQRITETGFIGLLSPRGSVTPDATTNKLFVRDIRASREAIGRFVKEIDVVPRQVLIEARIVEANKDFARELGTRLGFGDNRTKNLGDGAQIGFGRTSLGSSGNVFAPVLSTSGGSAPATDFSSLNLSLFNRGATRFLNLELSALESDGRGRVISSPRVLTANLVQASIKQGTEIPYVVSTQQNATVEFKEAVLKLDVTPNITPDGRIQLAVLVHKDRPDFSRSVQGVPPIDTKNVETSVIIENGGTVVIGGVYEEDESSNVNQVPLLGDIPVIGNLFKTTERRSSRKELLIFITPRIVSEALVLK